MAAMTMRFPVQSAGVVAGISPRDRVRFVLRKRDAGFVVVRMQVTAGATAARSETGVPGMHDHTPHHGGVVGMSGQLHLEALARSDGSVRVWLTDYWRRPRTLGDVTGRITLELDDGDRALPLHVADDALAAEGPPLAADEVTAHVELTVAGEPVEMDFLLPTSGGMRGAAGVPTQGCVAVAPISGHRTPRCVLDFGRPVTALAATPDGTTLLVAANDAGVSAWRLPDGSLARGFAPPPAIVVPDVALVKPHPEGANAIAVRPDGREAMVALETRLLRYDVATGALLRELPARSGVVRNLAWSADGESVLVAAFYDSAARLLRADGGTEWGRLPVAREAASVAFMSDGETAAVGSETGSLVLFDVAGRVAPRTLATRARAIVDLAVAGPRLAAASDDGRVAILRIADGALETERATGGGIVRLAVAPDDRTVAATGAGGAVHLLGLDDQRAEVLAWHAREVLALVWSRTTLVSGDAAGRVALWDMSDRVVAR